MTEPLIAVDGAHKTYGSLTALDHANLRLPGGEVVGLVGENGCGKSTLLKSLAGLVALDFGHITIAGNPVGVESKLVTAYLPDRSALPYRARISECLEMYTRFFPDFDAAHARSIL